MFVNFFLMFGSWRSLIRIQLEFKYLCWRNKEGVSKLTFACYLFLFRHGLHGKHRFSLFFFPWNPRNPCLKEIIKCILTHSLFYLWKRQCVLYRMLTNHVIQHNSGIKKESYFRVTLWFLSDPPGILLTEIPRWYLKLYISCFKHIPWIIPLICYVLLR